MASGRRTQAGREKDRELQVLYEISQKLGTAGDLEDALQSVLRLLSRRMGMQRGTVTVLAEGLGEIAIEVAQGLRKSEMKLGRYKLGEGITGKVVETGRPVAVPRIADEPLFLDRTGARKRIDKANVSFVCVPIMVKGHAIGTFSVDRLFSKEVALEEDVRLLSIIAVMIAQAVASRRRVQQEQKKLAQENVRLREELKERFHPRHIIGNSRPMQEVYDLIQQVAHSNATVLLRGETGTGKELVADAIHYSSARAPKPFEKVHCAALPDSLLEAELFGYEKGAFTGAVQQKKGRFELASDGSIFLDEIGDLNPGAQVKLLRVLQNTEFQRLGGTRTIRANARIVAATNQDLETAVKAGTFREDLYYRLNVFPIYLPSLRERRSDILLLADCFLERYAHANGKEMRRISTPAIDMLVSYHWPGNVRELENCIERAVLLSHDGVIHGHHLPPSLQTGSATGTRLSGTFESLMGAYEGEVLVEALKSARGNKAKTARLLGTTVRILSYRCRKLGIDTRQYRT